MQLTIIHLEDYYDIKDSELGLEEMNFSAQFRTMAHFKKIPEFTHQSPLPPMEK